MDEPYLRIGALSERVGVSPELLRAWEQRYRLLQPVRSDGGFRLYSSADEQRVRMRAHLDVGVAAAQAARLALEEPDEATGARGLAGLAGELRTALDRSRRTGRSRRPRPVTRVSHWRRSSGGLASVSA